MAPKGPFKVHSLSKHIEDTKKGLSAESQYNRRPVVRPSAAVKKEAGVLDSSIFGKNDDSSSDSSDGSDSSSDEEDGADFLKKLGATGAKTSTAPPKRRSRDEEIADSDVERNASAKKKATAVQQEKLVKKEVPSSDSSDESSSESESDKPKVNKANGVKAKDSTSTSDTSSSDSESESDSEEESGDEEENPLAKTEKPAVKTTTNGAANATTIESSSEESEEESSEDEEPAKPAQPAGKKSEAVAESSASESDESDDEDEADEHEDVDVDVDESMHISDRENNTQVATPNFIAPDFVLRKGDDGVNGQDVARIFNEAHLQGKQFWYFTVPSNVPISVVQNLEIPVDRAQLGDRVFSHDGQDYGVSFDTMTPKSSIQILIPSTDSSNYQPARRHIDQTMHINRITSLGGASASSVGPAPSRAPRAQPKGLKARYQPFGVNTPMGNIGENASPEEDEDVEMEEAPAVAEKPSKKDKKTKKEEVVQSTPPEQPKAKKDKKKQGDEPVTAQATSSAAAVQTPKADRKGKRKNTASEDDAVAAAEQLQAESQSTEGKPKKQKTGRSVSPDLGSEPPSAAKKQTPVAPPTIPPSSYSFSSIGSSAPVASTPTPKAAAPASSGTVKKSAKKVKLATPAPSSSQVEPPTGKKETPVPVPRILLSSRPKESPVPLPPTAVTATPSQAKGKKTKKQNGDGVKATASSQQSPPASAQSEKKKGAAVKSKLG